MTNDKKDKTITKAITTIIIRLCWPILIIKALEYSDYTYLQDICNTIFIYDNTGDSITYA